MNNIQQAPYSSLHREVQDTRSNILIIIMSRIHFKPPTALGPKQVDFTEMQEYPKLNWNLHSPHLTAIIKDTDKDTDSMKMHAGRPHFCTRQVPRAPLSRMESASRSKFKCHFKHHMIAEDQCWWYPPTQRRLPVIY